MSDNHEIFFSYPWDDDRGPVSAPEKIVNELYHSLLRDKFRVIRDKYNLQYKGLISEFISGVGRGRSIIVALSEKYLKSHYCMLELYEIVLKSHLDKEKFSERVLPVMVEFIDLTKATTIDYYLSYWANEYRVWDKLLKTHSGKLSDEQMQRYQNVKLIFRNFGMMTEWIINTKSLHAHVITAGNFADIKKELHTRDLEPGSTSKGRGARMWMTIPGFWLAMAGLIIMLLAALRLFSPWGSIPTKDPYFVNEGKIESDSNSDTAHPRADTQNVKSSSKKSGVSEPADTSK